MARFCTNCGKEIADGTQFCTSCGTKAPAESSAEKQPPGIPVTQTPVITQQTYQAPQQQQAQQQDIAPTGKWAPVSTGAFFGLQFLFGLPVIGWLICLIMAFAPQKQNLKNYARAMLIWIIISAVLMVGLFFLFQWIGDLLIDFINEASGGEFGDFSDIFNGLSEFQNDGFGGLSEGFDSLPTE